MQSSEGDPVGRPWKEIVLAFLTIGATAYGGPAIIGVMQTELQEKRQWVSKERFIEGLSLVNMLPGAAATQLAIFLGYSRGGWAGGLLAGLCFVLPAFLIMLALTLGYAAYGATPLMRGALFGLGPVVIAIFMVAVYRLGRTAVASTPQRLIALACALVAAFTPLGIMPILALAGATGVLLFHSRATGAAVLALVLAIIAAVGLWPGVSSVSTAVSATVTSAGSASLAARSVDLLEIGTFFLKVGAFSFGGGLSLIAFIQEQVVNQYQWLTQREFIDGLALGQFTPGPILMVSAYVGYKLAGIAGAAVAATAIFLPAFVLMLSILPVFARASKLLWMKAAMKAIAPAVIGVLAVSLTQMASRALPDLLSVCLFVGTAVAMLAWNLGAIKLMILGAAFGMLRSRILSLPGIRIF